MSSFKTLCETQGHEYSTTLEGVTNRCVYCGARAEGLNFGHTQRRRAASPVSVSTPASRAAARITWANNSAATKAARVLDYTLATFFMAALVVVGSLNFN